jgi:TPR repeat protein
MEIMGKGRLFHLKNQLGLLLLIVFVTQTIFVSCEKGSKLTKPPKKGICQDLDSKICFAKGKELELVGDSRFMDYFKIACKKGEKEACSLVIGRIEDLIKYYKGNEKVLEKLKQDAAGYCSVGFEWACHIKYKHFSKDKTKRDIELKEAMTFYEKRCQKGEVLDCKRYIELLIPFRRFYPKRYKTVFLKANSLACDQKYALSCENIAWKKWLLRHFSQGLEYFRKACSYGLESSCKKYTTKVLQSVVDGLGEYKKLNKGLLDFCKKGHDGACLLFSRGHLNGWWVNSDPRLALKYLKNPCVNGSAQSCNMLADMYIKGKGVKKDLKRAELILRKACGDGVKSSCSSLAEVIRLGLLGKKPNLLMANSILISTCVSSYKQPAKSKYRYRRKYYSSYYYYKSEACGMLGYYVLKGYSTKETSYRAERYVQNACNKGYKKYCFLLGKHFSGLEKKGSYYFKSKIEKWCKSGHGEGCFLLSKLHKEGRLKKSTSLAKSWLEKGCRLSADNPLCKKK